LGAVCLTQRPDSLAATMNTDAYPELMETTRVQILQCVLD
jgi:hypothetical protein